MTQPLEPSPASSPKFTRAAAVLVVLVALALAAAGLLVHKPLAESDDGTTMYLPGDLESQAAQSELQRQFPDQFRASMAVIVFHRQGGLKLPDDLTRISDLVSWIHHPETLPPETPEAKCDDVRGYLKDAPVRSMVTDPHLTARLQSADRSSTLVTVGMPDIFTALRTQETVRAIRRHLQSMDLGGLAFEITGDAGFYDNYNDAALRSIDRSTFVSVALVIVILLLVYRSPVAMLVPLATIGLAVHIAMRLLYLLSPLGFEATSLIEMFVVVIVFGSGTDFCLFVISRYKEEARPAVAAGDPGGDRRPVLSEAMGRAVRGTAMAVAASALTTMAGLSLMALATFRAFAKSGPSIAVALAVGCLASLTLAPALYLLAGRTLFWFAPRNAGGMAGNLWRRLAALVLRRPGWVIVAVLLAVAAPSIHAFSVRPTHNIFDELGDKWSSVRGFQLLKDGYTPGTMGPATLLVEADRPLDNAEGWALMKDLADRLGKVTVDGREMVAEVLWPGKPMGFRGPILDSPDELRKSFYYSLIRHYFFSADRRSVRIEVLLGQGPYTDESVNAAQELRRVARQTEADTPWITRTLLAGASSTIADIKAVSHRDFAVISSTVLAAVYLILLVVLRRPVLGLVLIAGTMLSFTAALGIADLVFVQMLGAAGLDWKITFFLLVLLVAVGVDYNIFLCTRIAQERRRRPLEEAVGLALSRTGGIISACGLIVAGTFASMIAGDLSLMVQLGFALAVGILIDTFLIRPLLVPAAALMLARWTERRKGGSAS